MKILAIGAHPDDIEIGCLGTLLKLKERFGASVEMLVMTGSKHRREQQEKASKFLDIPWAFGGLKENNIEMNRAVDRIERHIDHEEPTYIFTHHKSDTHQDHRALAYATDSACRDRGNILYYKSYSSIYFYPTVLVDIEETLKTKCEAAKIHISEEQRLEIERYILVSAELTAHRQGCTAMEGFIPSKFRMWESGEMRKRIANPPSAPLEEETANPNMSSHVKKSANHPTDRIKVGYND